MGGVGEATQGPQACDTCMYGHYCDKCHKLRYLKKYLRGGNLQFVGEHKEKHYKRKRKEEQRVRGERRKEKEKKKTKLSKFFYDVPTAGVR